MKAGPGAIWDLVSDVTRIGLWALAGWSRGRTNERGMRQTLKRIQAHVEGPTWA
jgi:hypothetical protein